MTVAANASQALLGQDRRLPLQGAVNCRDLGGYLTSDGRRLRSGLIFRSDQFAELTDADLEQIAALGLKTLCDFRGESERVQKPNRALGAKAPIAHVLGFMPHRGDELIADARDGKITPQELQNRVREIYRRFVLEHAQSYSRLLHLMIEDDALPLLFHCTSGRDRTGFGTAVLFMALGIPSETILADYILSDHFRRDLTFQMGRVDPAVMTALTQSHPEYMAAAFETIHQQWGSQAAYLRDGLGFSAASQQRLQDLLLEPASAIHS